METIRLDTIAGGALGELFDAELARILANITDPNTDTQTKRVMTFAIKFKPSAERDVADVEVSCGSKLAGIRSVSSRLFFGRQRGRLVAVESDPRQSKLFDDERPLVAVGAFAAKDGE